MSIGRQGGHRRAATGDRSERAAQDLPRRCRSRRRDRLHGASRRGVRPARPERRREVDDDRDAHHDRRADRRMGSRRRLRRGRRPDRRPARERGRVPGSRRRRLAHRSAEPREPCPALGCTRRRRPDATIADIVERFGLARSHRSQRRDLQRRTAPPARDRAVVALRTRRSCFSTNRPSASILASASSSSTSSETSARTTG